jgi:hypothetical protein
LSQEEQEDLMTLNAYNVYDNKIALILTDRYNIALPAQTGKTDHNTYIDLYEAAATATFIQS